ncbi:flavodoxin domain-containing protein [Brucepastera parasyntrophica]|uniref:flavodoxin domain-containing protein n=1 Tax=Brucepastera parasyntrophica TaxID=2880008 RepID=UPI00210D23E8|nr:flavodoxin domain-containing protein [Brucepastera parasyntrophica]ULQ58546.1 flavodoxin domain-containing protein [Brucepastera parasyntrophica]
MAKCAILYKSKYGSTRQYAEWIAEETQGDLFVLPKVTAAQLADYETLIIGGGLYAGQVSGISFLKKNFEALKTKKLIVFSVGASFDNEETVEKMKKENFPPEMWNSITFFHLHGALNYSAMNFFDRTLMKILVSSFKKKPPEERNAQMQYMIDTFGQNTISLNRDFIKPIVEAAKN